MAAHTGVQLKVIFNKIPQVSAGMQAGAVAEVARAGYEIEDVSKGRVPVLTGTLRRSIHTVISAGGTRATIGPSVEYGKYVEFGTRRMTAQPYMRPAFETVVPRFLDRMKALARRGGL